MEGKVAPWWSFSSLPTRTKYMRILFLVCSSNLARERVVVAEEVLPVVVTTKSKVSFAKDHVHDVDYQLLESTYQSNSCA
jgi:hypothetical protein